MSSNCLPLLRWSICTIPEVILTKRPNAAKGGGRARRVWSGRVGGGLGHLCGASALARAAERSKRVFVKSGDMHNGLVVVGVHAWARKQVCCSFPHALLWRGGVEPLVPHAALCRPIWPSHMCMSCSAQGVTHA
eukprot:365380-Chlamydomonas_euryale.AAC.12